MTDPALAALIRKMHEELTQVPDETAAPLDDLDDFEEEEPVQYRSEEERAAAEWDFHTSRDFIDYDLPGWVSPVDYKGDL